MKQQDLTNKTDRQLRAIYHNNSPLSKNFKFYPEHLQNHMRARHRAAYAELQARKA